MFQNSYAKRLSSVHFLRNKKIYFYVTQRYIFYQLKNPHLAFLREAIKKCPFKKIYVSKKIFFQNFYAKHLKEVHLIKVHFLEFWHNKMIYLIFRISMLSN